MKNLYNLLLIGGICMCSSSVSARNHANFSFAFQQPNLPSSVAAAYHSVALTGFNHDVVANGAGQADATTTTTIDFSNEYYAADFVPTNAYNGASAAVMGGGLPTNGQVQSAVTSGLTYQLADYSASNALLLRPLTTGTGTLNFTSAYSANAVYILWVATESQANGVGITIHFNDGTTQVASNQIAYDWVGGSTGTALSGLGRIGSGATQWAELNEFSLVGQCKLFEKKIDISVANQTKAITGVSFSYAPSGEYQSLAVFAINVFGESLGLVTQTRKNAAIFPNPSNGQFYVHADESVRGISAYNSMGQQIKAGPSSEISLDDFSRGVYYLKVEFENGISEMHKVVKN